MTNTGIEFCMKKLEQILNRNDNPLIYNHQSIVYERPPQFQLLYEELGPPMTQTLFINDNEHQDELENVTDLKKRFIDAAQKARDTIDLFVSVVNFGSRGSYYSGNPSEEEDTGVDIFTISENLEDVMRSFKSIKEEFMTMITDNMKIDTSPNGLRTQSTAVGTNFCNKNLTRKRKKVSKEIVVGLDHDIELIRDKLVENNKQLDVVSIVGMGGLGKTTLANKVFNDPYVVYHFHVRAWVTVSQNYEKWDLLVQVLASIGIKLETVSSDTYFKLREMLHKRLLFKRYLIVIDDIWTNEAWDDLKLFFPNDNTGSRILITSRFKEVVFHAKSHGFVHHLPYLSADQVWELLCKKVFHGNNCPEWLIKPGMVIAKNCHGLPLAVDVIAGVLEKVEATNDSWNRIAQSVGSFIASDLNRYVEMLALSFDHLPRHFKDCFLYLGGFPEDYIFRVIRLIWLWMAEGFIQDDRNQSLEEVAEDYLTTLVDKNLLAVTDNKYNGGIKACYLHDLLREIYLEASKETFLLKIHRLMYSRPLKTTPYKQQQICTHEDIYTTNMFHSFLYSLKNLRVLDLQNVQVYGFPPDIVLLVHLWYLEIWIHDDYLPSSICNIWSLQTLIVRRDYGALVLPNTISNLVNLRHLFSDGDIYISLIEKPMNLQIISKVVTEDGAQSLGKYFPIIKKLTCLLHPDLEHDFKSLTSLESLTLRESTLVEVMKSRGDQIFQKNCIHFPTSLIKLTLAGCCLPWSDISLIQALPKLLVLKLLRNAFVGPRWDAGEESFQQLQFLKLEGLNIQQWEASSINFPCLRRLDLKNCNDLEEIPLDIGYIPTLELIQCEDCNDAVVESLQRIQEEQHDDGNSNLKICVYRESAFKCS